MLKIVIGDNNDLVVDKYLSNYSVNIIERYATNTNFTSISGKTMNRYLGDRRELSVNFEPMETNQINKLISTIKKYHNNIPITYEDSQLGEVTKHFSCNNLPASTYFTSDDNRNFWTIPTVVFSETDESASENDTEDGGWDSWKYEISVGGQSYNDDEISNDTSISVSAGSSGFSVGQCCSSSISGSLLYKGGELSVKTNSILTLYCYKNGDLHLEYKWFVKTFTVEDKTIIHFSAMDAVAFIDNEYPMEGDVGSQFTAASATISELSGTSIEISQPAFPHKQIINQSGWSIRTLISYGSVYGAHNYTGLVNLVESGDTPLRIAIINSNMTIVFSKDNFSTLSIGIRGPQIVQIRVSQADMEDPHLEEGMSYDDFGIYYLNNKTYLMSNVLKLVCPWVEQDIKQVGGLKGLLNTSYGTEFNCDNIKVDEFYSPYTKINFEGVDNQVYAFYISNASYSLTSIGIFAQISGDTKSLSDFEYIGKTETQLKTKVALQMGYQNGFITQEDGIYWDDSSVKELVNSG